MKCLSRRKQFYINMYIIIYECKTFVVIYPVGVNGNYASRHKVVRFWLVSHVSGFSHLLQYLWYFFVSEFFSFFVFVLSVGHLRFVTLSKISFFSVISRYINIKLKQIQLNLLQKFINLIWWWWWGKWFERKRDKENKSFQLRISSLWKMFIIYARLKHKAL